jgi:hypothetical protein
LDGRPFQELVSLSSVLERQTFASEKRRIERKTLYLDTIVVFIPSFPNVY